MKEYKRANKSNIKYHCIYNRTHIFKYSLKSYAPQQVTLEEYAEFGNEENESFVWYRGAKYKLRCMYSYGRYYTNASYITPIRYINYGRNYMRKMSDYKKNKKR